jgi:hypothetical protein
MKWKEFKELVESKGINNNTKISYIDWMDDRTPEVEIYSDGSGAKIE